MLLFSGGLSLWFSRPPLPTVPKRTNPTPQVRTTPTPQIQSLAALLSETALGSPPCGHRAHTYIHTRFSQRPGTAWTSPPLFPGFSLWSPNPSTRRRITRTARVRKPSAENRSHIQKFFFPRSSACVAYPRHTTHILAFAFPSCYHDCPVSLSLASVFASSRDPFSDFMVHGSLEPCI